MKQPLPSVEDFYVFRLGEMWRYFKAQHFSFWAACSYLFFEFVRPQSIFPAIAFFPYASFFLMLSTIGAFLDPTVKWVSSPINKLMIALLFAIIISSRLAYYPDISAKHFMDYFGWLWIYFLIINIVNTKERLYIYLMIYIITSAKIALGTSKSWVMRGFSFTDWGLSGPPGFFQNSGELAVLMLMLCPLAFFLYSSFKGKMRKWEELLLIVCWVCPILTVMGASSRGSQVALFVMFLLMFRRNIFKIKSLIAVLVLAFTLFTILPQAQKDRFSSAGEDRTSQQRLLYWKHGWEMIQDNPFLGVGFYNFSTYYDSHYSYDLLYPHAELPHNIFIQVGTDTGFIGGTLFFMIFVYGFLTVRKIYVFKNVSPIEKAMVAGLGYGFLGFLIAGQFVTITYYPFMWIHLAFMVALYNTLTKRIESDANNPQKA